MIILYTCDACGIKDAEVSVRDRGDDETVVDWMDAVGKAASADHAVKSPRCRPRTLTMVKIPVPPSAGRIGDPTRH